MPEIKERLEQILEARRAAQAAITHAQSQYKDSPHFQPYSEGDKVWLDARNLKTMHPTFKLAPKRYGPSPITKRILVTTYALKLPPQWHIHPVFHASLLMPYKETPIHGTNFPEPPPDLIEGEPEWEVDQIVNTRCYQNQTQFLIKWKGYSNTHNSWEPEKNLNATELVEEYYKCNPRSVGAEEQIKQREISVHSITTHFPTPHITTTMPSRDSSTERLVARAMARGSFSETTTESPEGSVSSEAMEEDHQPPLSTPERDLAVEMDIANLVNAAVIRSPSPDEPPPPSIHPDFSSIISTKEGDVLRPPESAITCPNTPVTHHLVSTLEQPTTTPPDPRAAHAALTRLVHDPVMDSYPINYKEPPTCNDYPIELGREVDPANQHPGVGYWLNDPFGGHYFPFSIPNDKDPGAFKRTRACYIHLSDDKESLIGTLGKGYLTYGLPLYLLECADKGNYNPPPPLSLKQLENFSPDSPLVPKIQEVLEYLQDHRLTTEVARMKWLLKNQKALREQVVALYKTTEPIELCLLETDMQLTSVR